MAVNSSNPTKFLSLVFTEATLEKMPNRCIADRQTVNFKANSESSISMDSPAAFVNDIPYLFVCKLENYVPNICQKVGGQLIHEGVVNTQGCPKSLKTVMLLQQFRL